MSKKNKQKFKRQIKAQIAQQFNQAATVSAPIQESTSAVAAEVKTAPAQEYFNPEMQNLPQIKADLIRTGIVIGGLVLVMIALGWFDAKQQILLHFGDWLFTHLHINQ